MKPLPLAVVSFTVAGFIYLAIYGYRHQHDHDGVPNRRDQAQLSSMLAEPTVTVSAFAYLYPDYDPRMAKSLPFKRK